MAELVRAGQGDLAAVWLGDIPTGEVMGQVFSVQVRIYVSPTHKPDSDEIMEQLLVVDEKVLMTGHPGTAKLEQALHEAAFTA